MRQIPAIRFRDRRASARVFETQLACSRRADFVPYVAVLKRHRADERFALGYSMDGFSLALHFRITASKRPRLGGLVRQFDATVVDAGG